MTALDDPKVDADFVPVDLAVDYARWGWPAMPVALARKPDGTISKRPLTSHGHLDATTDTSALMEMFARAVADLRNGEVLGVGVVPGRADCVVFDHDIKHGGVGDQTFAVLVDEHGADWATCRYRSVSGGLNVVVRKLDAGCCIGNHSPWPSVDIRADSGWIVAPGTVTPWGSWTWERDPDDEAHPLATVPACPVTMWKLLRPSSGPAAASRVTTDEVDAWIKSSPGEWDADARRSFDRSLRRLRDAKPGGRHQAMVEAVGSLVGAVFANHPAGIEAVFSVWAQATAQELHRAEEPWDAIAWAVGREIANGRTTASLGGAARLDLPTRVIDDGELWTSTPGGFNLDALARVAAANVVDRNALLAAVLVHVALAVPENVALPPLAPGGPPSPVTVYLALVGPPGTGKGVATNIAARIVNVDGLKTITPSSGEGLVESYYRMPDEGDDPKGKVRDHRPVLVIYDELTRLVEVGQRATSSLYDVTLTGWTGADLTTTNAEAKRTREVKAGTYRLGMIASAQFGPTAAILAKSDLGMPQRFLFSDVTPPVSAVEVLAAFDAASAASRRSGWPTAPPAKDAP